MKTYADFCNRPETCTPQDWLEGWNSRVCDHMLLFYTGMGNCVARYPVEDVLGLIEDESRPCHDRDDVKKEFREITRFDVDSGVPAVKLVSGNGGVVTRESLLKMQAYYDKIDAANAAVGKQ